MNKTAIFLTLAVLFTITLSGTTAATTDSYNIGEQATQQAINDPNLGFNNADGTLLITTAGSSTINGETTEDGINAVITATGTLSSELQLTNGKGNIITLNNPTGPLEFTFITKKNDILMAKKFQASQIGILSSSSTVYISDNMADSNWNTVKSALGTNAFDIVAIANLWSKGAPNELLKIAGTSGVSEGLLSGYVMSKSFTNNFPLTNSQQSYHAMVTPGGGDDDVPMTILDVVPLKWVGSGSSQLNDYQGLLNGNPMENVYIKWDRSTNSGILSLMKYNQDLENQFTTLTGTSLASGTLGQLKYINWLYGKVNTDPGSLIVLEKLATVNKGNFDYLWGTAIVDPNDKNKILSTSGHGIDKLYIDNLNNYNHNYQYQNILPFNKYADMQNIGVQAAQIAQGLLGFSKGSQNLLVITSAGFSLLNNYETSGALDGITSITGSTINNLFSLKRGIWTPLWFVFVNKGVNSELNSVFLQYNIQTNNLEIIPVNYNNQAYNVFDISGNNLAGASGSAGYAKSVAVFNAYRYNIPDHAQQDYYIVSLANQWAYGMPYDFLKSGIGGGCPGSGLTQGYLIADYVKNNFALSANEFYMYYAITGHCKEQVIIDSLGLSAAKGTYFSNGLRYASTDPNAAGIFIKWNSATNTGKAMLLDLFSADINKLQPVYSGYYYRTMYWAVWYLDQVFPGKAQYGSAQSAFSIVREIPITQNDLNALLAPGVDGVNFIKNFMIPTLPVTQPGTSGGQDYPISPTSSLLNNPQPSGANSNVIAPGLPTETPTSSVINSQGTSSAPIPLWALGIVLISIISSLLYIGRDSVIAAVKSSIRPGK